MYKKWVKIICPHLNRGVQQSWSKPCLWPITDTECQVCAQMLRSAFLRRVQISMEKTISNIFLSMTASTNIIIYFYSKIRTVGGRSFFNKNPHHFHNNTQFCIFTHITNSSFCHVFVTNTAFLTFQDIENNQEYKTKTQFHYYWIVQFLLMIILVF